MLNTSVYLVALTMAGGAWLTGGQASNQASATVPNAVREHLDEASDMVDRLMRWKHIVTPPTDAEDLRVPPKSTLISIERSEAKRLTELIDAMAAQLPRRDKAEQAPRGDLQAHVQKAQEIARELMPAAGAASNTELVTIDKTSLERLDVELDALEDLAPIVATR